MEFEFLEVTETLTEVQVLVNIYNLLLFMSMFCVAMIGFKYFLGFMKGGKHKLW